MKTKILLAGNQSAILDDFFNQISDSYVCMSTSNRPKDLKTHIGVFQPDVFVYCVGKDTIEDSETICNAKRLFKDEDPIFILVGDKGDIDLINPLAVKYASLCMFRPISFKKIQESIDELLAQREAARAELEEARKAQERAMARAEKKHILVVDDDPTMLRTIKEFMEGNYIVATAPSGKFALKFLSQKKADLILLDYEMPEMNGPEVFQAIKDDPACANIPVVFLTGITDSNKIRTVLAMHPNGYLLKPVDSDRLNQTIEGILFE